MSDQPNGQQPENWWLGVADIATSGLDWLNIPIGTHLKIGEYALVEITQIGKECHNRCAIYYLAGDCIMPREGVFGRVIRGGKVRKGDRLTFCVTV